jgi:hypothetical protein
MLPKKLTVVNTASLSQQNSYLPLTRLIKEIIPSLTLGAGCGMIWQIQIYFQIFVMPAGEHGSSQESPPSFYQLTRLDMAESRWSKSCCFSSIIISRLGTHTGHGLRAEISRRTASFSVVTIAFTPRR